MPYATGWISINSPIGTPIKIANVDGAVDYTDSAVPFPYSITPPYDPRDGQVWTGIYEVIIYNGADSEESTTYEYTLPSTGKEIATITINPTQDCANDTASFNYTANLPVDASGVTYLWSISNPNNVVTTETTSSIVIDPTINGTYTITLDITYTVTIATNGGNETFLTRTATSSLSYTKSCGNAQDIICNTMYCCVKTALFEFLANPTTSLAFALLAKTAAAVVMMMAINCNKQSDAQIVLEQLNSSPYPCPSCGCGCS